MEDKKIQQIIELVRELSDDEILLYSRKTTEYYGRPQPIMRRIGKQRSNILGAIVRLRASVTTMPD